MRPPGEATRAERGESRRDFLRAGIGAFLALPLAGAGAAAAVLPPPLEVVSGGGEGRGRRMQESRRPPRGQRKFTSTAVEATIERVRAEVADRELAWLFENCFPNTLDTTVEAGTLDGKPDTFVITGDIHAMWLRDSSAQVWPYLPLARGDAALRELLAGVIHRQARCILIDPYANAFNKGPTGSEWAKDLTEMKPELHERKWEVDSLCYPIRLAHGYWRHTGDVSVFDPAFREAMRAVVRTFREQQRKENRGPYRFQRVTGWQTDTVAGAGYGNPIVPVGMICSVFRPSDDATTFLFLVPSNLFAVTALRQLAEISRGAWRDADFAGECEALAAEVERALARYAVASHLDYGEIWAYEADGFGNRLFMDDANVPSLLSLPYLGACDVSDPRYRRTRRFVLGEHNPWFFRGAAGEGVGGPHVGPGQVWPMSIIMRALTSTDDAEIRAALETLKRTHAGTGFMHESFDQDDPSKYTRKWFAWANTLFGELILGLLETRPHLLKG
jgi:meiotically up-regulated gene 157 (Mug157) protein